MTRICSLSMRLVQGVPTLVSFYNLDLYWPSYHLKTKDGQVRPVAVVVPSSLLSTLDLRRNDLRLALFPASTVRRECVSSPYLSLSWVFFSLPSVSMRLLLVVRTLVAFHELDDWLLSRYCVSIGDSFVYRLETTMSDESSHNNTN
jgi:hypothetical protein